MQTEILPSGGPPLGPRQSIGAWTTGVIGPTSKRPTEDLSIEDPPMTLRPTFLWMYESTKPLAESSTLYVETSKSFDDVAARLPVQGMEAFFPALGANCSVHPR